MTPSLRIEHEGGASPNIDWDCVRMAEWCLAHKDGRRTYLGGSDGRSYCGSRALVFAIGNFSDRLPCWFGPGCWPRARRVARRVLSRQSDSVPERTKCRGLLVECPVDMALGDRGQAWSPRSNTDSSCRGRFTQPFAGSNSADSGRAHPATSIAAATSGSRPAETRMAPARRSRSHPGI